MEITREQLIKLLADRTGYYQQDVRHVLNCLRDLIPELLSDVTKENDKVLVRLCEGIALRATFVDERERVDPRNRKPIVCPETIRLGTNYSEGLKNKVQEMYREKKAK